MMSCIANLMDSMTPEYTEVRKGDFYRLIPNPSKVNSYERAVWFVNNLESYGNLPKISEKQLIKIVNLLVKDTFYSKSYLENLEKLEKCFQRSRKYTLEKATNVFLDHIEKLQKEEIFDVNQTFNVKIVEKTFANLSPIGFAAMSKSPALLNALIKAGGDVNCGERNSTQQRASSPLHLIFVDSYLHGLDCMDAKYYKYKGNCYSFDELAIKCIDILKEYQCEPNFICLSPLILHSFFKPNFNYFSFQGLCTTPIWIALMRWDYLKKESDKEGMTLYENAITSLVQSKANIDFQNKGLTLLQYAIDFIDDIGLTKMLVQLGADLFVTTEKDETLLTLSLKFKKEETRNDYYSRIDFLSNSLSYEEEVNSIKKYNFLSKEKYHFLSEAREKKFQNYKLKTEAELFNFIPVQSLTSIIGEYLWGSKKDMMNPNEVNSLKKHLIVSDVAERKHEYYFNQTKEKSFPSESEAMWVYFSVFPITEFKYLPEYKNDKMNPTKRKFKYLSRTNEKKRFSSYMLDVEKELLNFIRSKFIISIVGEYLWESKKEIITPPLLNPR